MLKYLEVDEWIVSVIKAIYEDASTKVRMNGRERRGFNVKVGVHQGSVLRPLLFIILLKALSREFMEGLPMYSIILLYQTRLYRNSVFIEVQSAVPPDTMLIDTKDGYIETRIYRSIYHGPLNFDTRTPPARTRYNAQLNFPSLI